MTISRRTLAQQFSGLAGLAWLGLAPSAAQANPVEGTQYTKLSSPLPVAVTGKIEVVEFFWYGCPHCNALEPLLGSWVKELPPDVAFRRVPVAFGPAHEYHQRLFYALESLGLLESMHRKVFAAIHVEHKSLGKDADVAAFFNSQGQDGAKVVDALKSFTVAGKARQAKALMSAYGIDGVPTLGIQGRYTTSASQAGTHEQALAVADYLIQLARKFKA